jgi:penicillin-binding protein 1A
MRLGVILTVITALIIGGAGLGWYLLTKDLPSVRSLINQRQSVIMHQQNSSKVLASDDKTVILENGQYLVHPTKVKEVSPDFIRALVATEDRRFYLHKGVDPIAIFRAVGRNVKGKGLQEGGSTLTQQLTRQLFLTNERSLQRKVKEILLATQMEQELSKEEILELYMNYVYFGQGAYGIEAASEVFFNKKPKDLTLVQAALLAGLPQAPSNYNPLVNPELAKRRRNEVLQNLVEVEAITSVECQALQKKPLDLHPNLSRLSIKNKAPYFNQVVMQQVMDWFGLTEQEFWQSGYKVHATLNPLANDAARAAIDQSTKDYKRTAANQQIALVSLNQETGAVVAYEGGKNFQASQYDRLQKAQRSPGSTFKVFTYTEALRQGFSSQQVVVDEPVTFGTWKPENFDKRHHGAMTLARALSSSNNVIAVKLMDSVGLQNVINLAKELGIASPLQANLSTTLGGSSVYPIELVQAFSTIANHGVKVKPYFIDYIEDDTGEVVYQNATDAVPILDPAIADKMTTMLQRVVDHGTGMAAMLNNGMPVAGKTGTSDQNRDAWFVGYTPVLIAGVWVGNDDNTPMPENITGGSIPAITWKNFMTKASLGFEKKIQFEKLANPNTNTSFPTVTPNTNNTTVTVEETTTNTDQAPVEEQPSQEVAPDNPVPDRVPTIPPPVSITPKKNRPPDDEAPTYYPQPDNTVPEPTPRRGNSQAPTPSRNRRPDPTSDDELFAPTPGAPTIDGY